MLLSIRSLVQNYHWPDAIGQSISYRANEQGLTTGPTGMWKFRGHSVVSIIWASKTCFGSVDQCLPLAQMARELNSFWHRLLGTNFNEILIKIQNYSFMKMQGCIQVLNFKGEIPLNISEKGGSVHWKGGIQYKCYIRFCQIWEDLPPLFTKFGGQVANLGESPHPSLYIQPWKCMWKYRLQNGGHFVQGEMRLTFIAV